MSDVNNSALLAKNDIRIDTKQTEGVVILEVKEGSGASKSDLKKGDIVIKINDNN